MLTAVAVLIIVLGLMVSLARNVRNRSATVLSRDLLAHLDVALEAYRSHWKGQLPAVRPLVVQQENLPAEPALLRAAELNSADFVRAMRVELSSAFFADLPVSIYDRQVIRDAWGTPIVLMPAKHPLIGMAPRDAAFFVSAGPDRRFGTRADNLFSYEQVPPEPQTR
jgi:hypothetical protein